MSLPVRSAPIDGVRGIAVLTVLFSHTSGRGFSLHPALDFKGIGHVGVYLFFCLSAFLLAGKLFEEGVDRNAVKRFYIKRLLRIIPLYYSVLVFVYSVQFFTGEVNEQFLHINMGLKGFIQHLIFYRGDGVFWSVVVEEQFYILVPLWIYLIIRFPKISIIGFSILMFGNAILYSSHHIGWPFDTEAIRYITTNDRDSGNYVDIFICTIIMVYFAMKNRDLLTRYKKVLHVVANTGFILIMALTVIMVSHHFLIFNEPFRGLRFLSLLYAFIFSLFIISVDLGNPINRILSFLPLRYFGIFGFSIYLLHMCVFQLVGSMGLSGPIGFLVAVTGVLALSSVTYYTIERPCIKLAYRLISRWKLERALD